MRIRESSSIDLSIKNLVSIVIALAMGLWFGFGVIERLNKLESKNQLIEKDLESANEFIIGVPKGQMVSPQIQELFFLVEDLYKTVEKLEKNQEQNMTNKVNISFLKETIIKALKDIEKLKDKQREFANGNGH
jgi:hypothetical protein|tara:strand:- start:19194 stop:19592 length:399 start_codon:yes stop_codon:yes gene_type:complete